MSRDGLLTLALFSGVANIRSEKSKKPRLIPLESYWGKNVGKKEPSLSKATEFSSFWKNETRAVTKVWSW